VNKHQVLTDHTYLEVGCKLFVDISELQPFNGVVRTKYRTTIVPMQELY